MNVSLICKTIELISFSALAVSLLSIFILTPIIIIITTIWFPRTAKKLLLFVNEATLACFAVYMGYAVIMFAMITIANVIVMFFINAWSN